MTNIMTSIQCITKFVLGNWLEYYSRNWKKVTKGKITFHYQVYKRDNAKIRKAIKFLSFLKREYNVEVNHLDIYISKGWNESQRLKGFGYDIGECAASRSKSISRTLMFSCLPIRRLTLKYLISSIPETLPNAII